MGVLRWVAWIMGLTAPLFTLVGQEVSVLYEKAGRRPGQMVGKSQHLMAVHVEDTSGRVGELVRARVSASAANSLAAGRIPG